MPPVWGTPHPFYPTKDQLVKDFDITPGFLSLRPHMVLQGSSKRLAPGPWVFLGCLAGKGISLKQTNQPPRSEGDALHFPRRRQKRMLAPRILDVQTSWPPKDGAMCEQLSRVIGGLLEKSMGFPREMEQNPSKPVEPIYF